MSDNYTGFAKYYDQVLGSRKERVGPFIKEVISKYHPEAGLVLEIACGTGNILGELKDEYDVEGLDLSHEMLEIAKKKLPEVKFHQDDMTKFFLSKKFDVVICVFDSVNHLLAWQQWVDTFKRASEHLSKGGIFVFDVMSLERQQVFLNQSEKKTEFGERYATKRAMIGEPPAKVIWNFKVYEGDEMICEDNIPETSFPK